MLPRLNLLYSYAYLRKGRRGKSLTQFEEYMLALTPYIDILVDSGAFTDYMAKRKALSEGRQHTPISVEEYSAACKVYHGRVWQYIMLDVIQNIDASRQNLNVMVGAGLRPMPVFIYPESYEVVPELVEINPHICVAGGVDARRQFAWQRYQTTYKTSDNKARIHALGFVKHPDIFQLPLASVDSSSWCSGGRFGNISHYTPRAGFTSLQWREVTQERQPSLWRHLQRCGIKPSDLSDPEMHRSTYGIPAMTQTFAYIQLHQHCHQHGFRYFFATPNTTWTGQLLSVVAAVNHQTNAFDYHEARRLMLHMQQVAKQDFSRFTEWSINVLKEHTAWQTKLS